uniref:Uncharacterized protein n=1 Tax=Plectus sambesii TaxID=2011161 RepID=A0A914UI70_9BILA
MIIASSPFANMVIMTFYRLYSMLPFVTPILTLEQLCESEVQVTPPLYCKYVFMHKIIPYEAEIIHEEPYLVLFHHLVRDTDAKRVINLIEPYERMAGIGGLGQSPRMDNKVRNSTTGVLDVRNRFFFVFPE